MDQELKQRLIGAAVITALAAIFVPMLFDDPVKETGKSISELKIPEIPAKMQDVEIAPLPEKIEEVTPEFSSSKPVQRDVNQLENSEEDLDEQVTKPKLRLSSKDTKPTTKQIKPTVTNTDVVAEDVSIPAEEPIKTVNKPTKLPVNPPVPTNPVNPAKSIKPANPVADNAVLAKSLESAPVDSTIRWYLNVGTFTQKTNAETLLANLKQQGFLASLKDFTSEKGTIYKVRIGPMLDKAKAQAMKSKLAQVNINSFVAPEE